jgi:hypothetical protein
MHDACSTRRINMEMWGHFSSLPHNHGASKSPRRVTNGWSAGPRARHQMALCKLRLSMTHCGSQKTGMLGSLMRKTTQPPRRHLPKRYMGGARSPTQTKGHVALKSPTQFLTASRSASTTAGSPPIGPSLITTCSTHAGSRVGRSPSTCRRLSTLPVGTPAKRAFF